MCDHTVMGENYQTGRSRALTWERVGELVLWVYFDGHATQSANAPNRTGQPGAFVKALNLAAEVRGVAGRCCSWRQVVDKWVAEANLNKIIHHNIPRAEADVAWCGRESRGSRGEKRRAKREDRERALDTLQDAVKARRALERQVKRATRAPGYMRGMDFLSHEFAKKGIR